MPLRKSKRLTIACKWANRKYREEIALEYRAERILDCLQKQPMFFGYNSNKYVAKRPKIEVSISCRATDIMLRIYRLPIERVIEELAGPLHREFGLLWHLQTTESQLQLKAEYKPHVLIQTIWILVNTSDQPGCKIIPISSHTNTYTHIEYALDCA